ncbi:hypothetical protein [Candidatus Ichthyocystis hellenicum]|uniref:hypothetical protein n=1 Tax=Candidatus Ichthyocystis hellenicum TaxID=1561003 RepID=UPI000B8836D7|nr:hypothetical protein [Candidatus Ichthyocystis hellenicum]
MSSSINLLSNNDNSATDSDSDNDEYCCASSSFASSSLLDVSVETESSRATTKKSSLESKKSREIGTQAGNMKIRKISYPLWKRISRKKKVLVVKSPGSDCHREWTAPASLTLVRDVSTQINASRDGKSIHAVTKQIDPADDKKECKLDSDYVLKTDVGTQFGGVAPNEVIVVSRMMDAPEYGPKPFTPKRNMAVQLTVDNKYGRADLAKVERYLQRLSRGEEVSESELFEDGKVENNQDLSMRDVVRCSIWNLWAVATFASFLVELYKIVVNGDENAELSGLFIIGLIGCLIGAYNAPTRRR